MRSSKKIVSRQRGRPKSYDRDEALDAALSVFRSHGYSATSLDMLTEATGMKRPSLAAAFGNKKQIYCTALAHFQKQFTIRLGAELFAGRSLRDDLEGFFEAILNEYQTHGCATICTATSEACEDDGFREILRKTLVKMDRHLNRRFQTAADAGEFPQSAVKPAGRTTACLIHSLAIRTRAGIEHDALRELLKDVLEIVLSDR